MEVEGDANVEVVVEEVVDVEVEDGWTRRRTTTKNVKLIRIRKEKGEGEREREGTRGKGRGELEDDGGAEVPISDHHRACRVIVIHKLHHLIICNI